MIDMKYNIRLAFFQCLNLNCQSMDNLPVKVYDDVQTLGDVDTTYILLENQTGTPTNNQAGYASKEDIMVTVVAKDPARVNRRLVDYIANQALQLLLPTIKTNGLVTAANLQFLNLQLAVDQYQDFFLENAQAVCKRMMTFSLDCYQL